MGCECECSECNCGSVEAALLSIEQTVCKCSCCLKFVDNSEKMSALTDQSTTLRLFGLSCRYLNESHCSLYQWMCGYG